MHIGQFVSPGSLVVATVGLLFAAGARADELSADRPQKTACGACGPKVRCWQHDTLFLPRPAGSFIAKGVRLEQADEPKPIKPDEPRSIKVDEPELVLACEVDSVVADGPDLAEISGPTLAVPSISSPSDEAQSNGEEQSRSDQSVSPTLSALASAIRTYPHPASRMGGGSATQAESLATLPETPAVRVTAPILPNDDARPVLWQPSATEALSISAPISAQAHSAPSNASSREIVERRPVEEPRPRPVVIRPSYASNEEPTQRPVSQTVIGPSQAQVAAPSQPAAQSSMVHGALRIVNPFVVKSLPPQGEVVQTAAWAESPPPSRPNPPADQPAPPHAPGALNPLRR